MKVIIEGHKYQQADVQKYLWDGAFKDIQGYVSIGYVGYYYNPNIPDCVFILPKVLLNDKDQLVIGPNTTIDPKEIITPEGQQKHLTQEYRKFLYEFADAGQLGGYVVACNHILKKEGRDNPTIGILICKEKDSLVAQYALEASSQPLGISEYELAKLYPEKVEGTIPTIEEIEQNLGDRIKNDKD